MYFLTLLPILIYLIYYKLLRFYSFLFQAPHMSNKNIGKPLPSFPNGWFVATWSHKLKNQTTMAIDLFGQNIVIFRGSDGSPYALQAYCAHMGANLALGGKILNQSCIQCPFHGWQFDGKTGFCIQGKQKKQKQAQCFTYQDNLGQKGVKKVIWREGRQKVSIRKYPVIQLNGYIYVWIHAVQQFRQKPYFYPLDFSHKSSKLSYRGHSINRIHSHVQDIPQNGADIMHFFFVHPQAIKDYGEVQTFQQANWIQGSDPELKKKMEHQKDWINSHKSSLINKFINEQNKESVGVLDLDCYLQLPFIGQFFFFNVTAFQVGPGLVYLFLKAKFFEIIFFQHVQTKQRYLHDLYHEMYLSNWIPYWLGALYLRGQATQVFNDGIIWDHKRFARKVFYNLNNKSDSLLLKWREWFSQFYEGSLQKQRKLKNDLEW